ncbi:TetR/AcrR family transcriptional regulator [Streptomyces alkaliterrae]|uniref:TetR family transcriptional regulator n=2 Tax=Streptomyces alkaliterrae TaxID=2213162 RepID=A0A5P0YRK5_9ACTN|nr:TetR/AcrR family transcriptional regulator [Streptomyces alkaliterrae]MBB1259527.1 TetR/AcrR family transcriptional regulator [Streptomyces alkaliterrae]MQS02954.1 TetR family transcriptional regulator [Streptomyces alkaliterrae]
MTTAGKARRTQAERRAQSREALLEAAARGLSRNGYANLVLAQVAAEAGYTRGALYHQFAGKEALALAVVRWVDETWTAEVGAPAAAITDPVEALTAMARGHARYCRRDIANVMNVLWTEFAGREHPVGSLITEVVNRLTTQVAERIAEGRQNGAIPPGPPPATTATAYLGALEGVVSRLAGQAPHDAELAEATVRGVLGLHP